MFFNLTWRNAKRSRSENLIYFLTMITAVAMFYIVLSLGQQDVIRFLSEIESDAVERLLTNLLPTVYLCALLFVFFLVVFANKYQLECRSRELGLYLMFGMTKIKLFIQIMTEGLITSFLALLGGLVCGGFLSEAIGNIKSTASDGISSPVDWSKFRKQIVQHLPQDVVDPATQEDGMYSFGSDQPAALNLLGLIDTGSSSPYLLPVSSYNRLLDAAGEEQISLGNNEVVYYLNPDFLGNAQDETVTLLNQIAADAQANNEASLSINERPFYLVPSVPMKGLTADENIKIITALIVSDEIYSEFVNSDTCMVYWNFCIPNELVETKGLMLPIMEARDLLKPSGLYYESYLNNFGRQLFYVISGSYTTLYMGFMFLIIACALLALQFLTQMQTTKSRYLTLSILGARREQIKRSINQQVLWYFLLPLILACISGAVGIYAMQLYLYSGAAHLEQSYPLLIAMAVIVVLVMVIYGVAVARTANREIGKLNYKPNS